jgi:tetratricopeptide (TPR) repeat protein
MSCGKRLLLSVMLAGAVLVPASARGQAIQRGFDLERAGRAADAAEAYLAAVQRQPSNTAALLGLERVLPGLGRLPELLPLVQRAVRDDPESEPLRALLLRTYVVLDRSASAEELVRRWARLTPQDEQPYREWGIALQDANRLADARRAFLLGRRALGRPHALAIELAELAERSGAWEEAAREWATAVTAGPSHIGTAAARLREIPSQQRAAVLSILTAPAGAVRRLAGELALAWGDPERAWSLFEAGLGSEPTPQTIQDLRRFADFAGASGTPAGRRVRGLALARMADLVPAPLAARARTDAARALLDAGDYAAARQVLEKLATDPATSREARALAHTVLIRALIENGQLEAAHARLDSVSELVGAEDRAALRLELARRRLLKGEFDAVDRLLVADSSLEATAVRGWQALYRGDLARAAQLFGDAGPYSGPPGDATDRSRMLALLQRLGSANSPALGAALLQLARGDSAGALGELQRVADRRELAPARPDILLLAGQVATRLGGPVHEATASRLFAEVLGSAAESAALPAAELEWARLLLKQGRAEEAIAHFEHLILTYPGSAVVPQARRELDRARGTVPQS